MYGETGELRSDMWLVLSCMLYATEMYVVCLSLYESLLLADFRGVWECHSPLEFACMYI